MSEKALLVSTFTVGETLVANLVLPQYFQERTFTWILTRFAALNLFLWALYAVQIYPRLLSPLRHLPRAKDPFPVINNGFSLLKRPLADQYLEMMKTIPNDGLIRVRTFLNIDHLLLTSPKAISEVLVTKPHDFGRDEKIRGVLRRLLGDGLIVVEGGVHRHQRKNIQPSFTFRRIKDLYPTFWRKSIAFSQQMAEEVRENFQTDGKGPFAVLDIAEWAPKVTLDIIGIAGLGRDFNTLKHSDDPLAVAYHKITSLSFERLIHFGLSAITPRWFMEYLPWQAEKRFQAATDTLRETCSELVAQRRREWKMENDDSVDLLSNLMRSNNFSDDELTSQLLTFLAAGHETTSSAFSWVTYLLAIHKDVQTRLRDELRDANIQSDLLAANGADIADTLESLPLLNGVCNETLRLYPTVPLVSRVCARPTTILGRTIPKGTNMFFVPGAVNLNPEFWGPQAEEFIPDRWIDPETGKPNNSGGAPSNYVFLTFLHGPRSCIGQGFAKAELRSLVAAFVSTFHIELVNPGARVYPNGLITSKPDGDCRLKVRLVE